MSLAKRLKSKTALTTSSPSEQIEAVETPLAALDSTTAMSPMGDSTAETSAPAPQFGDPDGSNHQPHSVKSPSAPAAPEVRTVQSADEAFFSTPSIPNNPVQTIKSDPTGEALTAIPPEAQAEVLGVLRALVQDLRREADQAAARTERERRLQTAELLELREAFEHHLQTWEKKFADLYEKEAERLTTPGRELSDAMQAMLDSLTKEKGIVGSLVMDGLAGGAKELEVQVKSLRSAARFMGKKSKTAETMIGQLEQSRLMVAETMAAEMQQHVRSSDEAATRTREVVTKAEEVARRFGRLIERVESDTAILLETRQKAAASGMTALIAPIKRFAWMMLAAAVTGGALAGWIGSSGTRAMAQDKIGSWNYVEARYREMSPEDRRAVDRLFDWQPNMNGRVTVQAETGVKRP